MIDCHTHAFPALGEQLDRFLDRLSPDAGFILRDALEDVRGWVGPVTRGVQRLASRIPSALDIERVASFEGRIPTALRQGVEAVVAAGLVPPRALTGDIDALLSSMDQSGIERAVLIASRPLANNHWLLHEAWPRARARLVPVAMLPDLPRDAPEHAWAEGFEALVAEGARGFQIYPGVDGLDENHPAYRAMFDVAQRQQRFIVLHTGKFELRGPAPVPRPTLGAWEPLLDDFPTVRVCLAHMNSGDPNVAWDLMRRHEQLFADTSWQPEQTVRSALKEVGARRILLGSDWPLLNDSLQANALDILKRAATEKELERVVQYTPLVFLGEA